MTPNLPFLWLMCSNQNPDKTCMLHLVFMRCCLIFTYRGVWFMSVKFISVAQSCLTLCDPMDCNIPGFPVHHQLPQFTQIHVHWVGDAIQPSHPVLSPSFPAFNLSQHQGLFKWVSTSHQVAKVLEFQLQHQSFQWLFRTDDGLVGSPCCPKDSQESSPAPRFKSINFLYDSTLTSIHATGKTIALTTRTFVGSSWI